MSYDLSSTRGRGSAHPSSIQSVSRCVSATTLPGGQAHKSGMGALTAAQFSGSLVRWPHANPPPHATATTPDASPPGGRHSRAWRPAKPPASHGVGPACLCAASRTPLVSPCGHPKRLSPRACDCIPAMACAVKRDPTMAPCPAHALPLPLPAPAALDKRSGSVAC